MDPQSTLEELEDCIDDKDYPGAVERLAAYYQWRLSGGFEPVKGHKRGDEWAAQLAVLLQEAFEPAV